VSDLTFNKIAGAVLATGLAVFLLREVSDVVFHQEPPEEPGYAIEVALPDEGGGAAEEAPIDWGTVLPAADIEAGKKVAAKCVSCHTFEAGGANGTGPALFGVIGRKPGAHGGFAFSDAMVEYGAANPSWTHERLGHFLASPKKEVSGTKMTFVGLKKPEDRIAIIAYLQSLGSTLAIPAPNPAPVVEEEPAADEAAEEEAPEAEASEH